MTGIKSLKIGNTGEPLEFIDQVSRTQIEETREQVESVDTSLDIKADTDLSNLSSTGQAVLDAKQDIANISQTLDTSTTKYPSNAAVKAAIDAKDSLPSQTGNNGKFLTTDGTTASWSEISSVINNITQTSGEITLEVNKIYSMNLTGATTFALPNPINKNIFNQIKIMAKVTGTPTINWGTIYFSNKTTPEIEEGSYDVYFDYDNLLGGWVCIVMAKGVAE